MSDIYIQDHLFDDTMSVDTIGEDEDVLEDLIAAAIEQDDLEELKLIMNTYICEIEEQDIELATNLKSKKILEWMSGAMEDRE